MVGYDLNDGSLFNYIMDSQNLWAVYNMCPVEAAKKGADQSGVKESETLSPA